MASSPMAASVSASALRALCDGLEGRAAAGALDGAAAQVAQLRALTEQTQQAMRAHLAATGAKP